MTPVLKQIPSLKRPATMVSALVVACVVLAACGGGSGNGGNQAAAGNSGSGYVDQACFTQMDDTQRAQLVGYAGSSNITSQTANGDGTQDICVLEPDGQGGYNEAYYRSNDGYADYYLYAALMGPSNALMLYGLSGGGTPTVADVLVMQMLTGVNGNGGLYHPYTRSSSGNWSRQTTVINQTVNHIHYGKTDVGSFSTAHTQAPPSGYAVNTVRQSTGAASVATTTSPKSNISGASSAASSSAASSTRSTTSAASTTAAPTTTSRQSTSAGSTTSRRSTSAAPAPTKRSSPTRTTKRR